MELTGGDLEFMQIVLGCAESGRGCNRVGLLLGRLWAARDVNPLRYENVSPRLMTEFFAAFVPLMNKFSKVTSRKGIGLFLLIDDFSEVITLFQDLVDPLSQPVSVNLNLERSVKTKPAPPSPASVTDLSGWLAELYSPK